MDFMEISKRIVAEDKRHTGHLRQPHADIRIVAVYLAIFFLRFYPSEYGIKVESFLSSDEASVIKDFISSNPTPDILPTDIAPVDPMRQTFFLNCLESYHVSIEKIAALQQFISENKHCLIAPDHDCLSHSEERLSLHKIVVHQSQNDMEGFMVEKVAALRAENVSLDPTALLAISTTTWNKIQNLNAAACAASQSHVTPAALVTSPSAATTSRDPTLSELKTEYIKHAGSFNPGNCVFLSTTKSRKVLEILRSRAHRDPLGASAKTLVHFGL